MIFRDVEVEYIVSGFETVAGNKKELVSRFFAANEWHLAFAQFKEWKTDIDWTNVKLIRRQISEMYYDELEELWEDTNE
jgi:hypothetical protein